MSEPEDGSSRQFLGDEMLIWTYYRLRTLHDNFPALRALNGAENDS
jgi:hypothetical protein